LIRGKVIKSTGSWYKVITSEKQIFDCRIIGKFRLDNFIVTNPVAVGDMVDFVEEADGKGLIKKILKRRNYVARQSPRQRLQVHLLASNIDLAVLFVTIVEPSVKTGFIDRFLLTTEPRNIPTIIVFNKADIYSESDLERFYEIQKVYNKIGYTCLLISAMTGQGMDDLKAIIKDKTTLLCGQSGVGKSTVMNTMEPNLDIKTGEISDYSGKGQHTTTFAEMHQLDMGGEVIDTPGIKMLAFNNMEVMDVMHNFREFFVAADKCKYANCTHRNEPNCAVKSAIEQGEISEWRYDSYLQIIEEIEDQNYWERHKDM
jgi:ribosome biogenesis GTPase / thiamine phosphate phosphatase